MLEKRTIGIVADDNNTDAVLVRYIYSNHLQSSALELDSSGEIISYEEYHPYGTTAYQATNAAIRATAKRYRYTGKERDDESGLYYHGVRYYIPWLCRWTAVDPAEVKYAGISPYNYSFNNPVIWNDPSGADPALTADESIMTVPYDKKPSDPPPGDNPLPSYNSSQTSSIINIGLIWQPGQKSSNNSFLEINLNLMGSENIGDWKLLGGAGISYYTDFLSTGKSGFEFRISGMGTYNDAGTEYSIGTNQWIGTGEMSEFNQRTGIFKYQKGDFGFSYENDGMPLFIGPLGGFPWMGNGGDSYRTNAVTVTVGKVSLDLNQFTGFRPTSSYKKEDVMMMEEGQKIGRFGEKYPSGFVTELGTPYRLGALTVGMDNYRGGLESDWIRHAFQDRFAHGKYVAKQPGFPMQTADWNGYSILSMRNQFTSW